MTNNTIQSYKDLRVWQKSMDLVIAVYALMGNYPKSELYVLAVHTRKTAISIPSNIAEGKMRGTRKDYRHFLLTAFASGAELETQLLIAKRLSWSKNLNFSEVDQLLDEVMRMLNVLIAKLV